MAISKTFTVGGPNTLKWNGISIGLVEDSITVSIEQSFDNIVTNDGGTTIQDSVFNGCNVTVTAHFQEYSKIKPALLAAMGAAGDPLTNVGKLMSTLAKPLVISPIIAGRTTYTFLQTYPEGGWDFMLGAHNQGVDVTFRCLPPTSESNTGKFYIES